MLELGWILYEYATRFPQPYTSVWIPWHRMDSILPLQGFAYHKLKMSESGK